MDGKEFISSFVEHGPMNFGAEEQAKLEMGFEDTNDILRARLARLYADREVHFLTDVLAPAAVADAQARLSEYEQNRHQFSDDLNFFKTTLRYQGLMTPDKAVISKLPTDFTANMSPEELAKGVDNDQLTLQAELARYSEGLTNTALRNIFRRADGRELNPKEIAQEVKAAINGNRLNLQEVLQPWRGVVTVESDFSILTSGRLRDLMDMRVSTNRKGAHIKEWVPVTKEWHGPIHVLCSMLTEAEVLLALQEWVIDRQLPYLPISAPFEFERGDLKNSSDGNKRADILLCCLSPERNEIIPVQVKNTVTYNTRDKYHPGVVLVAPRHLGLESSSTCIVKVGNRAETGHRIIVKYGSLTDHYFAARKTKSKIKAPKHRMQAFTAALQPAFDYFDTVIGQQVRAYDAKYKSLKQL